MHRLIVVGALMSVMATDALAFTCPWLGPDSLHIYRVGSTCDVVVYVPAGPDDPELPDSDLPTRVIAHREDVDIDLTLSRSEVVETRVVEHTAYCNGATVVAMRTNEERWKKLTFEVAPLVAGETLRITKEDGSEMFEPQTVDDDEPCRDAPLEDTWCGSNFPGQCPEEPEEPDPNEDVDDTTINCASGGSQGVIVGLLLLPWVVLRGRRSR